MSDPGFREWAAFEEYVVREPDGSADFANRMGRPLPGFPGGTIKRRRSKRRHLPHRMRRIADQIRRASIIAAARKWLPANPLLVHIMAAEDALLARRR
jgi:hypothetical protein